MSYFKAYLKLFYKQIFLSINESEYEIVNSYSQMECVVEFVY